MQHNNTIIHNRTFNRYYDDTFNYQINYQQQTNKPTFNFNNHRYIDFDLQKHDFKYIQQQINKYKGYSITFNTIYNNKYATGKGANKHVFNIVTHEIINKYMTKHNSYFIDVDHNNIFWTDETNIQDFTVFIAMAINNKYLLPYHFAPALLENISNKKLCELILINKS